MTQSRIAKAIERARKLEDYQCEPHQQALAVIEAAEIVASYRDNYFDSPRLKWVLNAWADSVLGEEE